MASIHQLDHRAAQILSLAVRGWHLFPATAGGKQPLIADWPNQATRDEARLRFWLKRFSGCNWGVATGPDSGVFVLDVDGEPGLDALANLEFQGCVLPKTLMTRTWRGTHAYFQWPSSGTVIRNSAGKLAPGLDVRGTGGYVIVPPSVHPSGTAYEFTDEDAPIACAPEWLLGLLAQTSAAPERPLSVAQTRSESIPEGQRNQTLMSLSGGMRRKGMTLTAIEAALLAENAERCAPPLPEREVKTIARSASQYEAAPTKGTRKIQTTVREWPAPLGPEAFQGLAGEFVRLVVLKAKPMMPPSFSLFS